MDRWSRFIDWCQRPSKIKIRTFNPRNAVVLVTFSIILASSITFGTWTYNNVINVPGYTFIDPEAIETLTITADTTLTEDYFGQIIIGADGVTLDGDGHMVIGPGPDVMIWDLYVECNISGPRPPTGILLEGRTGVTVKNCLVTGFSLGFLLDGSGGNTLQGNTANDNAWVGFVLESSSNNTLLNNTANDNGDGDANGFELGRSFGNTLQGNTANGNWIGFVLEMSDGNILRGNTAKNNTRSGFEAGYSSNNTFFHNNLVDNTIQAAVPPGYSNTWDNGYSSGGNYWSDYKGVDSNGDGIGDTPYVIIPVFGDYDENNVDRFPLMAPTSVFDSGT